MSVLNTLIESPRRYLLYDTNPGEGFNLRRDVFTRIAVLVRYMRQYDNWVLVLPPWGRIGYHWRERGLEQSKIAWAKFFDLEQLNRYIPVLELTDYFEEIGEEKVDEIWYLQNYEEGWGSGWQERIHERDCINQPAYQTDREKSGLVLWIRINVRHWLQVCLCSRYFFISFEKFIFNDFKNIFQVLHNCNGTIEWWQYNGSTYVDRGRLLHRYYGQ